MRIKVVTLPLRFVQRAIEAWVDFFLDRGPKGAIARLAAVSGTLGLYWSVLALSGGASLEPAAGWIDELPFPISAAVGLAALYLAPRVLIHVIPVLGALWLGLRLGSLYLTDLFELESTSIASRYLRGALFGIDLDTLEISNGSLEGLDYNSPLRRIGGPGHLTLHLGLAVVFEDIHGHPQVYGASKKRFIRGFERLRDVVDLRDQLRTVDEVRTVTRDGVEVYARDAQMVFRVHRTGKAPTRQEPYPVDEKDIRRLVYGQTVGETGSRRWDQILPGLVKRELQSFVANLTIEDFLALQPELPIRAEAPPEQLPDTLLPPTSIHIPRRRLTERFHQEEVLERLRDQGLDLDWVGVGTWEIRERGSQTATSPSPAKTLLATWRGLQQARVAGSPDYLRHKRNARSDAYSAQVLRAWIESWHADVRLRSARPWQLLREMISKLEELRRDLTGDPEFHPPLDFDRTLEYLRGITQSEEVGS